MALISISIQTVMLKLSPSGPWLWESNIPLFVGAGYVVPALIAHDMGRQGIKRTTKAVLLAGCHRVAPRSRLRWLLQLKGVNDLAPLAGFGTMSIASRWIPLAVLLSAAASWGVAHNYDLKAGGFVGAAYVGMFMGDPYQVAVAFAIALVTFVLVRYVLMNVLDPVRSAQVLGDAADVFDALVDAAVGGPIVLQRACHQPSRSRIDGPDPAVRTRTAGQRHGPNQPPPGRTRCRAGSGFRRADDMVDPIALRRPSARTALDGAGRRRPSSSSSGSRSGSCTATTAR